MSLFFIHNCTENEANLPLIYAAFEYVYIFEFKMDGTAREALEQIERNGYAKPYLADKRKVICIGVSFSSTTRTVEDWEEISVQPGSDEEPFH